MRYRRGKSYSHPFIPIMEEALVVEKQFFLKEELHILLQRSAVQQSQKVKMQREEVRVDRPEPRKRKEQ